MIARSDREEPRLQIGRTGAPFFGRDVEDLQPGAPAVIDAGDLGTPLDSLSNLSEGDYFVQAFINVYSALPPGRRAHRLDARRPVGRAAVGRLAREPHERRQVRSPRSGRVRTGAGHPARRLRRAASRGGAAGHRLGQAIQVRESVADEVLGTSDLSGRDRAAAPRLRHVAVCLPGRLHPGPLLARGAQRLQRRQRVFTRVDERRVSADASRYLPASHAIFRRFVRRQLRERGTVRRRHPAGADSGGRAAFSRDPRAVRAAPVRRVDGRMGGPRPPDLPPRILRRHVRGLSRPGHLYRRRGHQRLRRRQRLLQAVRLAARAHRQLARAERTDPGHVGRTQPLRAGERHARTVGRADRHLVGCLRSARRRWIFQAALRQGHGPDRSPRRRVLARPLRPAGISETELGARRSAAGGQAARHDRDAGHVFSEQFHGRARGVARIGDGSARRRDLRVPAIVSRTAGRAATHPPSVWCRWPATCRDGCRLARPGRGSTRRHGTRIFPPTSKPGTPGCSSSSPSARAAAPWLQRATAA